MLSGPGFHRNTNRTTNLTEFVIKTEEYPAIGLTLNRLGFSLPGPTSQARKLFRYALVSGFKGVVCCVILGLFHVSVLRGDPVLFCKSSLASAMKEPGRFGRAIRGETPLGIAWQSPPGKWGMIVPVRYAIGANTIAGVHLSVCSGSTRYCKNRQNHETLGKLEHNSQTPICIEN